MVNCLFLCDLCRLTPCSVAGSVVLSWVKSRGGSGQHWPLSYSGGSYVICV